MLELRDLLKSRVRNIPSAVKRGEVEYCVIQLDYNSQRHSNRGRNKGSIDFCACELYKLQIIKSFLRLPTQGVPFLIFQPDSQTFMPKLANFDTKICESG